MSYPEPTYLGETGEASATFRQADHEPEVIYPTGTARGKLILFAPGARREAYFEGLAEFSRSGRPSDEEMADFYRHDNVWLDER